MSAGRRCRTCKVWHPADTYAPGPKGGFGRCCMACLEAQAHALDDRRDRRLARSNALRTWHDGKRWVRQCSECGEVKGLRNGFYKVTSRDGTIKRGGLCKTCHSQGANKARLVRLEDPFLRERERAKGREKARAAKQKKPELLRAQRKRQWQRVKNDPELHARERENSRMNYRLRRERAGLPVRDIKPQARLIRAPSRAPGEVPVAPLVSLIDSLYDRRLAVAGLIEAKRPTLGGVCDDLGVNERTYRRWREEQGLTDVGDAEAILRNAGVEWHEVYSYDDHAEAFLAVEVPS